MISLQLQIKKAGSYTSNKIINRHCDPTHLSYKTIHLFNINQKYESYDKRCKRIIWHK